MNIATSLILTNIIKLNGAIIIIITTVINTLRGKRSLSFHAWLCSQVGAKSYTPDITNMKPIGTCH